MQEPPGWNSSHKGALGRETGGRQGGGRGDEQKESLQELKERFMARLQEVGTPVDPKGSSPSQLQCICIIRQDVYCLTPCFEILDPYCTACVLFWSVPACQSLHQDQVCNAAYAPFGILSSIPPNPSPAVPQCQADKVVSV